LEGSVGVPCLATTKETTYVAIGKGEEVKNIKAVVQLDKNRGRRVDPLERLDVTFTNNIGR
jgi:hypothetical protein